MSPSSDSPATATPRVFPPTQWSLVLAATCREDAPGSATALEAICRAYWYPLYAYVRRCGQSADAAQDITQSFFALLLERHWLDSADRTKGRLRTFLIVALKNFMAKEWRRAAAQCRGGGRRATHFDTAFAESRFAADATALAPDEVFDRQWALTLLDLTVSRLQAEFVAAGKPGAFEALKVCLLADRSDIDYAALASRLGMSEGAARVSVHRFRKRFRAIFREEISQTLSDGTDVETELRHLAATLARQ